MPGFRVHNLPFIPGLSEYRIMDMLHRLNGAAPRQFFSRLFLLTTAVLGLLISSCRTTIDLVLDDPVFLEDMVNSALQGETFNITPEDYPDIRNLLSDDHPDYRLAGVILAIQTEDEAMYPDIINAALDENLDVSETAKTAIRENPEAFRRHILNLLNESDPSRRSGGLLLLTEIGGEDIVPILIEYFNDPNPDVRNQASRSVREVTDRKNTFLREAMESSDPLTASIAYRTLGRYTNPDDAPVFIAVFASDEPDIRREAQLAFLRLGDGGLPFLHIEAANSSRPYRVRLSALEVIQGLRSTESLSLLMSLLNDDDERIRLKAETILGTYGSEAVPALTKLYRMSEETNRIYAVRLMGEIGSASALSSLASALNDPSMEVQREAMASLRGFKEAAWPAIRNNLVEAAVILLREGGDPWLVSTENGKPNIEALFLLITTTEPEYLEAYLLRIETPNLKMETIISLKAVWDIAEEFSELDKLITEGNDLYLHAWRQYELYSVASRKTLKLSFTELHEYFESRNLSDLEKAGVTRAESRRLEGEARKQKLFIDNLTEAEKAGGEARLNKYRELREILVRSWEYTIPELRPLAEMIYADRAVSPESLASELELLE